ncbi:MAG: hypothetical protein LBU80_05740 [Rikenellaceae bacterium]|jgi:hypothetical protein|nr:hypothetical protein [Rikenellaceae bacterium]
MKKLSFLIVGLLCVLSLSGQNITGTWNGQLEAGPQKLRLVVNITQQDAAYTGTMDSPDQGVKGIPLSSVTFVVPDLTFEIQSLRVVCKGALQNDTLIVGTFTQSGTSFPLSLTKVFASRQPAAGSQAAIPV